MDWKKKVGWGLVGDRRSRRPEPDKIEKILRMK